jgi:hypothetical protein
VCHRLKPFGEEGGRSTVVPQKRDHNVHRVWSRDIKRGEAEAISQQFASTITPSGVDDGRATLLEGEALALEQMLQPDLANVRRRDRVCVW